MNQDKLLFSQESNLPKIIVLILGSKGTGKTTIIENISKSTNLTFVNTYNRTFYKISNYKLPIKNAKADEFLIEFREIDSCELFTDYKMTLGFFEKAYAAFVVADYTDSESFEQ
jgi:predicted ATPase